MLKLSGTRNYIKALSGYVAESGQSEKILDQIKNIIGIFKREKNLLSFFISPIINPIVKKNVVGDIAKSINLDKGIVNFINLLVEKGKIKSLVGILESVLKTVDSKMGIKNVTIHSPFSLSDKVQKDVLSFVKKETDSDLRPQFIIDKELISGLLIKVENKMYDFSFKHQLENLKKQLVK